MSHLGEKSAQYVYQMVRTDSREMKLDAFVRPPSLDATIRPSSSGATPTTNAANRPIDMDTSDPVVIDDERYVMRPCGVPSAHECLES